MKFMDSPIIIKALKKNILPKQNKIPEKYYEELFRLNTWKYNIETIKSKSDTIQKWTKFLFYDRIGVIPYNSKKDSDMIIIYSYNFDKKSREYGEFLLNIEEVIGIFKLSKNMKEAFEILGETNENSKRESPFEFDEEGHTIESIEENNISSFDEFLKKALDYNPNEHKN